MFGRKNTVKDRREDDMPINPSRRGFDVRISIGFILVIVIVIYIGLRVVGGIDLLSIFGENREGKVTTISESTLKDIIEISDLSTIQFFYNSICDVKDADGKVKYHVAYQGKVDAGIDLTRVGKSVDDASKTIIIDVPPIKIQNISVDIGKLEYIFEDSDAETESVSQEAYKACKQDLQEKAEAKKELKELAMKNAKEAMRGLIEPWVDQMEDKYQIDVRGE